jgi:hypothetical protein
MKEPVFRHPTGKARFLRELFFETTTADKTWVLYTLKDREHEGFPSLYLAYMAMEDLTEYEFANKYLEGWEHWVMLTNCAWFKPYVERWRKELDLKIKARYLKGIKQEAASGSRNALGAMKYLLERGWEPKEKHPKISKEDVLKEEKKLEETLQEQAERVGLTIVK